MKWILVSLLVGAVPMAASAQLGRMLDGAAKRVDQAGQAVDQAADSVDRAAGAKRDAENALAGAAAPAPVASGLTTALVEQLGIGPEQATGGAGAIFSMAQGQMPADDFAKVASGIPEMDALLAAAPEVGAGASTSRGAAALGALAGTGGSVGAAAQLAGAFSSLDLGAGMVSQFVPICVDYVRRSSGPEAAVLLQAVLP